MVSHEDIELTERDYYLLGLLVEGSHSRRQRSAYRGHLPRGCTDAQAERLVQAGYLESTVLHPDGSGQKVIRYSVTEKGRAAWRTYRFKGA